MKSILKRVSSVVMAAAMVLSVAAVSPVDAQAASKLAITKKSAITAGKTYTYNVKGVTKAQYIKVKMSSGVTVKCNSKTVKKNVTKINGGKTIALKVKAADKVANYKATVKAVVYDKKTNKKVKTLTTQSTVKCTALKVTAVYTASSSGKYLVAEFNRPLEKLNPADISIKKLNTEEFKGVEDVKLASNGKSATITLVGDESIANAGNVRNQFVETNIEYEFSITQSGVTASKVFTVDAVAAYVTVSSYNVALREITYTAPSWKNNYQSVTTTVKLPESVNNDDFQDLLGTTVSVWYNRNNVATKLTRVNETVVEGAFQLITEGTAVPYFKEKTTGKIYYVSNEIGDKDDIHGTYEITSDSGAFVLGEVIGNDYKGTSKPGDGVSFDASVKSNKMDFDYAKLVLYPNDKIRAMVDVKHYDKKLFVTKVEPEKNLIYCGNTSYNLKGYSIISNNKLSSIAKVNVGDVVFIEDSQNNIPTVGDAPVKTPKLAEIYTTTKEGKVEAAYDNEFKFDGTNYANADRYVVKMNDKKEPTGVKAMEYAESAAFVAAGGAATAYLDRAGQIVFVKGDQKFAAKGSDVTLLATADMQYYKVGLKTYVQIKGFDGVSESTYAVDQDLLSKVTVYNRTGATITKNEYKKETGKAFTFVNPSGSYPNATDGRIDHTDLTGVVPTAIDKSMIELHKDASGNVTEITIKHSFNPTEVFVGGKTYVKEAVSGNEQNYQITASTPVYAYNGTKYVKVDYSQYSATTVSANTLVYTGSTNGKFEVAYVLVQNETLAPTTYVDGVITKILKADKKAVEVELAVGDATTTYTLFRDNKVKEDLNNRVAGDYVRLGVASDGKTLVEQSLIGAVASSDMTSANMSTDTDRVNTTNKEFKLSNGTVLKLANQYTIVRRDKNFQSTQRYKVASLSDLGNIPATAPIKYHYAQTTSGLNTGFVDVVVIEYEY